ncbi:MAG: hypothetical protein K2X04_11710 [Burkholderiales bacterium]|nr:hypothetical protein [Burkholderiales bacterium]
MKKLVVSVVFCIVSVSVSAAQICGGNTHSCRDEHNGGYKCCHNSTKHHQYDKKQHKSSASASAVKN